ncbi:hypothetical protein HU200_029895 [Digitaria exilis]|uniref:Uncharacterized protein n=1 Tax=Digitaria exilis TaxID=1010633 RepID=A0A835BPG0_9POAL|nr:hypothetical protein HU200_029895 [Digitaria exilis]
MGLDKEDFTAMDSPSTLEDQGYYQWCELEFEWYFDTEFCEHVGFEDYQRLVLRNNGEYEQWEYYRKTCNTLQGDQEYIQFWEKLSSETKVSRHKTYYDYAKKKLDIAEKIGLIVPSSPDCTKALIADGPAGDTSPLCITALGLAGDTMKRAPRQEFTAKAVQPIAPGPEGPFVVPAESETVMEA